MVLNALCNLHLDGASLARQMDTPRWFGPLPIIRRVPRWATFPWGVTDIFRAYGVAARWRMFGAPQQLKEALQTGAIPMLILGGWRPVWAHYLVLVAYDPKQGWGFADPANDCQQIVWRKDSLFQKQWRNYANQWINITPRSQSSTRVTGQ